MVLEPGYAHTNNNSNNHHHLHLNVNCKPINLLDDAIGGNGDDLGFGNDFLGTTPKAQFVKGKIDELVFINMKDFRSTEDKPQTGRKSSQNTDQVKDWCPEYTKNSSHSIIEQTTHLKTRPKT